jgi:hypothetical protein
MNGALIENAFVRLASLLALFGAVAIGWMMPKELGFVGTPEAAHAVRP